MSLAKVIFPILLLFGTSIKAQDKFTSQPVIWLSASEDVIVNDLWRIKTNIQQRQFIETKGSFQFLGSSTIQRKLSKNLSAGMGFMFFDFRRLDNSEELVDIPELRPYEYVALNYAKNKVKFFNRLLLEQRFQKQLVSEGGVSDNYRLNHRLRFKWQVDIPIGQKLSLTFSDEPMINFGPDIVNNTFDQNRLIVMTNYKIRENLTVGTGYMNWIFRRATGSSFDIRHVWLIQISHQLRL